VVVYLRPQHSVAASVSSMLLTGGRYDARLQVVGRPPRMPKEYLPYFDYYGLLARWASVFGKNAVQPRLWHELPNQNVIDDFLEVLGAEHLESVPPPHRNGSLCAAAERFLFTLNGALAGRPAAEAKFVRERMLPKLHALSGDKLKPTRAEAAAFMAQYEEANNAVRDEWFPGRPTLFSEDYSSLPEKSAPMEKVPAEFLDTLIRTLLVEQK
jgi:hypothetical protein